MDYDRVNSSLKRIDSSINIFRTRLVDNLAILRNIVYEDQITRLKKHLKTFKAIQCVQSSTQNTVDKVNIISGRLAIIESKLDVLIERLK